MLDDFINDVSPGIRAAVTALWNAGFETVDSGDGSNFMAGMDGALDHDHVFIQTSPTALVSESHRLVELIGRTVSEQLRIECSYDPMDGVAIIAVTDPDLTGTLRRIFE